MSLRENILLMTIVVLLAFILFRLHTSPGDVYKRTEVIEKKVDTLTDLVSDRWNQFLWAAKLHHVPGIKIDEVENTPRNTTRN